MIAQMIDIPQRVPTIPQSKGDASNLSMSRYITAVDVTGSLVGMHFNATTLFDCFTLVFLCVVPLHTGHSLDLSSLWDRIFLFQVGGLVLFRVVSLRTFRVDLAY